MKWIKTILCCIILMVSCKKPDNIQPPFSKDIFSTSESVVMNGSDISFKLNKKGTYIIKLIDKNTEQIITKEKITGKIGINTFKIYTKAIPVKYLYLVLCDEINNQINKTTIIIN